MATAAAALIVRARREIQHHFFSEGAVRADRAVAFKSSTAIETRQFERMLERGTIKREDTDRYWIDVVAYDIDVQRRHRRVLVALIAVIILLAVGIILVGIGAGPKVTP